MLEPVQQLAKANAQILVLVNAELIVQDLALADACLDAKILAKADAEQAVSKAVKADAISVVFLNACMIVEQAAAVNAQLDAQDLVKKDAMWDVKTVARTDVAIHVRELVTALANSNAVKELAKINAQKVVEQLVIAVAQRIAQEPNH